MLNGKHAHDAVERRLRDQPARGEVGALERKARTAAPARGLYEPRRDVDAEHGRPARSERARDAALATARVEPALPAHPAERGQKRAVEESRSVRIALDPANPGLRVRCPARFASE